METRTIFKPFLNTFFKNNLSFAFLFGFFLDLSYLLFLIIFVGLPPILIFQRLFFSVLFGLICVVVVYLPQRLERYVNELHDVTINRDFESIRFLNKNYKNRLFYAIFIGGIGFGWLMTFEGSVMLEVSMAGNIINFTFSVEWGFMLYFFSMLIVVFMTLVINASQVKNGKLKLKFSISHPDNSAGFGFFSDFLLKGLISSFLVVFYVVYVAIEVTYYASPLTRAFIINTFTGFLILVPILLILFFLIPLLFFRSMTLAYKHKFMKDLSEEILKNFAKIREAKISSEDLLLGLYYQSLSDKIEKINEWPFSKGVILKILAMSISPLVSYIMQLFIF
jgi:hypothetical protein